jgi:hypothetical protein
VASVAGCPRCGGKLMNPEGLGWCPKCGYCRSLEEDAAKVPLVAKPVVHKSSPLGVVEFFDLLAKLPRWMWVLLGGMATVAAVSVAGHFYLPNDSLARALWSSIQLGLGALVIFVAQVWALILIAPKDAHLGPKDVFFSIRLWGLTLRRLPEMRRQVWMGGWGVSLIVCAVCVVGGLSYWTQFYKPKKLAQKNLIAAAAAAAAKAANKNKSLEESIQDFADTQDLTKQKKEDEADKPKADVRPTVQCVIIGYTVEDKVVSGLVLARLDNDKLKYAGVVQRGFTPQASEDLFKRLAPLVQPEPLFPNLKVPAIWVKPSVFCEVRQSGYDDQGRFKDPSFAGLLTEK